MKQEVTKNARGRAEFDILRLFAIFLVIYNHEVFFVLHKEALLEYPYALLNIICKTSVPLFFMMSGSLLLPKDEPLRKSIKRIGRFCLIIVFACIVQVVCSFSIEAWVDAPKQTMIAMFGKLVSGARVDGWFTNWYLMAYLSFLVFLPILRGVSNSLNKGVTWYLIVTSTVLTGCIPVVLAITHHTDLIKQYLQYYPYLSMDPVFPFKDCVYIFYIILGLAVDRYLGVPKRSQLLFVFLILIVFATITWVMLYFDPHSDNINESYFLCAFSAPMAVCIFVLFKAIFGSREYQYPPMVRKCIMTLGKSVIVVFLFENIFRHAIDAYRSDLEQYLTPYCAALLITLLTFLAALSTGVLLRKLPGLRSIL